ncbi:NAD(P)-dependent oxidoreductase [Mesorhizobium sp. M5C.F.Ca.IN.020.14.1.1]|nr:NAD(P)-dependent oxidoreductase [Mesorhizobium sp. M5C.F.Ca.IN.020.14.1.1]
MKIGIIGLGQMGRPIALNLLKAEGDLLVVGRSGAVTTEFEQLGAAVSTDPAALAEVDAIFTCLPNGKVVGNLLFGEGNLTGLLRPGHIVVDLGTTGYLETLDIARRLTDQGVKFLDAPISGMASRAREGSLTLMCGGERDTFESMRGIFSSFASKMLYMGKVGNGQLTKLINQILFNVNAAALAEILPLSAKLELDPDLIGEVINSGTGRSFASEFFIPRILSDDFSQGYPMNAAYKDLVSCARIASEMCVPLPVTAAATASYQMTMLRGYGSGDKGSMVKAFEDLLCVQFRSAATASALDRTEEGVA